MFYAVKNISHRNPRPSAGCCGPYHVCAERNPAWAALQPTATTLVRVTWSPRNPDSYNMHPMGMQDNKLHHKDFCLKGSIEG